MGVRHLALRAAAVLAATAVVTALPVATSPTAAARPVPPQLDTLAVEGVHRPSLATLDEAQSVGEAAAAGMDDDVVALTPPRSTDEFQALGVTWDADGPAPDEVSVRVRTDGRWGEWTTLEIEDDHGPDPGSSEGRRGGSAPLITGPSDGVQVRVDAQAETPEDVRVDLVDPGSSPADSLPQPPLASAEAAASRPTILPRSQWGADETIRGSTSYGTVRVGFVHHTATSNDYTAADVPAILRSIYAFHVLSRGWNDIGYNFLVDRFGRVWEGRYGGVERAVVGAHTAGYNSSSFAASALGDFTTQTPPAALTDALAGLFAWKLGIHHVDPQGAASLVNAGVSTTFQSVSGHRDAAQTACPGQQLYAMLPELRRVIAARQGTEIFAPRLTTPRSLPFGTGGATVEARASTAGTWQLTVASTCDSGVRSTSTGTKGGGVFSAVWDGRIGGSWAPPGEYRITLSVTGTGGSSTAWSTEVTMTASDPSAATGCAVHRLSGVNRYATAVEVARAANPSSPVVVLASGESRAMGDALVAGPLAVRKGGVLLLTRAGGLPPETAAELARRGARSVYLVGGEGAISAGVVAQLGAAGVSSVVRLGGSDRFATAAKVAAEFGSATEAVIANGLDASFADGLVASGPAAASGVPILLVRADRIPLETSATLRSLGVVRTVVTGGVAVVHETVAQQLPSALRVGGKDRYESSVAVARWAMGRATSGRIAVASGAQASLVDALAGGQLGLPTVYVRRDEVPPAVGAFLQATPAIVDASLLGGASVISVATAAEVRRAITR